MGRNAKPLRAEGLEINEAGDGFIIYDPTRDRVHYLNHTAALVLELATGQLDVDDMATWIGQAYSLDQPPVTDIERLIGELTAERLLQGESQSEPSPPTRAETADPRTTDSHAPEGP